jgi:hypothetical protein
MKSSQKILRSIIQSDDALTGINTLTPAIPASAIKAGASSTRSSSRAGASIQGVRQGGDAADAASLRNEFYAGRPPVELVDLAAFADKRRDIEIVRLHGAADGLRHGGQVRGFTRGGRDAGRRCRRDGRRMG